MVKCEKANIKLRRKDMKFKHTAALIALTLLCSAAQAEEVLHIYNWTDYLSKPLLEKFTKDTGIQVSVDTFDNNETLLSKLRAGSSGYDITVASTDFLPILKSEGLIQKIDIATLAGYENLDDRWKNTEWDPGNAYSIPWHWGVTSYNVDTDVYKGPTDSLKLLFEPPEELKGKVGMFSSPTEVIALALRYLDKPPCNNNPEDLKAVDALLQGQKPFVKTYDSAGLLDRQVSGETVISQIANGEAMRARFQKPSLKFVFGKEGGVAWVDSVVVPTSAARPDLAKKFISYVMDPKNSAMEQEAIGYPTGVKGTAAFLPENVATAPELQLPDGYVTVVNPTCPEDVIRKYDLIWTKLRQ
jgi:spermidine/putrescine transport system substrate-binding protein